MENYHLFTDEKKYVAWQNDELRDWKIAYWIIKICSYITPFSNHFRIRLNREIGYCNKRYTHNKSIGGSCVSPSQDILVNLPSITRVTSNEDLISENVITIIKHEDIHKVLNLIDFSNSGSCSHHYVTRKLGYET